MSVTSISRDTQNNVSIVRMISTDNIATITSPNYILNQMPNIRALNNGFWQWYVTDFIACNAADGNDFLLFTDNTFSTVNVYKSAGAGTVTSITAGAGLSGGTITTSGTIALAAIPNNTILSNISGVTAVPIANSLSAILGTTWADETAATTTMVSNFGYTSDDGLTLVTFMLPVSSKIGDFVEINGKGSGGWSIAQGAGQQIQISPLATTLGVGGSLSSTGQYDNVRLRCLTANTIWTVVSMQSTGLTVV
jgi:hypothetical protein